MMSGRRVPRLARLHPRATGRESRPGGLSAGDRTHRRSGEAGAVRGRAGELGRYRALGRNDRCCAGTPRHEARHELAARADRTGRAGPGCGGRKVLVSSIGPCEFDHPGPTLHRAGGHFGRGLPRASCKGGTFLPRRWPASSSSPWVATVGAESSAPDRFLRVRRWCRIGTRGT